MARKSNDGNGEKVLLGSSYMTVGGKLQLRKDAGIPASAFSDCQPTEVTGKKLSETNSSRRVVTSDVADEDGLFPVPEGFRVVRRQPNRIRA